VKVGVFRLLRFFLIFFWIFLQIYQKGDTAKHKPRLPLEKYLAVKVGVFPDVYECIANSHMERGDGTAALIAAERSTKLQVLLYIYIYIYVYIYYVYICI